MRFPFAQHMVRYHPLSDTAVLYKMVLEYERREREWEEIVNSDVYQAVMDDDKEEDESVTP